MALGMGKAKRLPVSCTACWVCDIFIRLARLQCERTRKTAMTLDPADVLKIAHLARLAVTDQQAQGLVKDLSNILELVEQMNAVDTTGVEPLAHPLDMGQRLRPDEVAETDQRVAFQAIAPLTENGLYLVPRVIE